MQCDPGNSGDVFLVGQMSLDGVHSEMVHYSRAELFSSSAGFSGGQTAPAGEVTDQIPGVLMGWGWGLGQCRVGLSSSKHS